MREFVSRSIAYKKWIKRLLFVVGGASAGFAYYYFIGCNSGTCPISSNPYISTAYGAVMGLIIPFTRNEPKQELKTKKWNQ